jgi:hypothetical protein
MYLFRLFILIIYNNHRDVQFTVNNIFIRWKWDDVFHSNQLLKYHQLFALFSGRLQHLPEFKFPASTTHRLPPLKYKPRFQFFSGSHAMLSAKWSWYFTTILEYIKWFLVEKIRFFLKQKPLFTLFIVYFIWITYILRDVSGFQTLYKLW